MKRRDLIRLLGSAAAVPALSAFSPSQRLLLAESVHARLGTGQALRVLDPHQNAMVSEIAEMILPETETPGAKAVRVTEFIDLLLGDWYSPAERDRFLGGLAEIDARAREEGAGDFLALAPDRRLALLTRLDTATDQLDGSAEQAFARLKSLTVYGYFTSRDVREHVLTAPVIPGRFDGCAPFPG
jgi:hypothetical protein